MSAQYCSHLLRFVAFIISSLLDFFLITLNKNVITEKERRGFDIFVFAHSFSDCLFRIVCVCAAAFFSSLVFSLHSPLFLINCTHSIRLPHSLSDGNIRQFFLLHQK